MVVGAGGVVGPGVVVGPAGAGVVVGGGGGGGAGDAGASAVWMESAHKSGWSSTGLKLTTKLEACAAT